jgi:hypothetical protein
LSKQQIQRSFSGNILCVTLHLLKIIPLLWIGFFHSQEKTRSKLSDHLRAKPIRELITVRVQETNAEPLLPIGQTLRVDFKELQQVPGVRRLIHFLFREDRQQALNDVISKFPIVQSRAERPKGVQDSFLIISVKSVLQPFEFMVDAEVVWHSITIPLGGTFSNSGICSRSAALRDEPAAQGRNLFLCFPALALQLASSPRDRAGLLPAVPLRGTESVRGEQRGIPRFAKTQRCGARTLLFVKEKEVTCRPPSIYIVATWDVASIGRK